MSEFNNEEFFNKIDNNENIEEIVNGKIDNLDKNTRIKLSEKMTIGIEIESIGKLARKIKEKDIFKSMKWKSKNDPTINETQGDEFGVEVISSVLTGNNEKSTKEINVVSKTLQLLGQHVNTNCGAHVHIGADYLKSPQAYKNLLELWANTEKILYIISNDRGEVSRSGVANYAPPISGELEKDINEKELIFNEEDDLETTQKKIVKFQRYDRSKGINFLNLRKKR